MTEPAPRIDFANLPAPEEGILATLFITVRSVARSRDFYSRVLGGTVVLDENPCIVRLSNSWILMNPGGPPTPDKPGISVVDYQPGDTTSIFLNLRVADIQACYEAWKVRGPSSSRRPSTAEPRSAATCGTRTDISSKSGSSPVYCRASLPRSVRRTCLAEPSHPCAALARRRSSAIVRPVREPPGMAWLEASWRGGSVGISADGHALSAGTQVLPGTARSVGQTDMSTVQVARDAR
jgi:hypothetical protein